MKALPTYVIAEAGVNHNGSLDLARQMIAAAAVAGADAVKFQIFKTEKVLTRTAPKAEYQLRSTEQTESFLEMGHKLELAHTDFQTLKCDCQQRGINFLASPFDIDSLNFLARSLCVDRIKIASGEITHGRLLLAAGRSRHPVILSTGMSRIPEIESALAVLAFGYSNPQAVPGRDAFASAYRSPSGQLALRENVTLLHCTTEYPAPADESNLRAMDTLRAQFGLPVGLSDHTPGIAVSLAAVARGARVIEKHFTLDRTLPGPDHTASLEPAELKALIEGIRTVETALGTGEKAPALSESKNRPIARRSLVAAKPIRAGEPFTEENLESKRPGTGVSPMELWDYLGRLSDREYQPDDLIQPPSAPSADA